MKRSTIVLAGALSLTAGAAFAALGPQFGLPQGWAMTNTTGYGTQTVNGNAASAMCVECHTVNPSDRILQVSQGGGVAIDTTAVNRGTHAVMNVQSGAANAPWGVTNSGGGFVGGFGNAARDGGQYYRRGTTGTGTNWTSGATSKFQGTPAALTTVLEGGAGFAVATSDLICESCHNLVINTATGGDNDLLVGNYDDNIDDRICTGCHSQDETPPGSRQAFHANDNLPAFAGNTVRKRHHVMTGDLLTNTLYGTTGVSSTMWAPSASDRLLAAWCATPYATLAAPAALDLTAGAAIAFRDACNVAGSGTRAYSAVAALGDITPTGAAAINCSNCHRPHNAKSASGAFILRMGDTSKGDFVGNVGSGKFNGLTNASRFYGLRRQSDVGDFTAAKVYQEYRPLCAGCHYGY
jgi:hypothetical protein